MENNFHKEIEETLGVLKDPVKITGSTNYAKVAAKMLLNFVTHAKFTSFNQFLDTTLKLSDELSSARSHEPLAVNAIRYIIKDIEKCDTQQLVRVKVLERIETFFRYIDTSFEMIRSNGESIFKDYSHFYTHSNSSLVKDILVRLHSNSSMISVTIDESNPNSQGKLQAKNLSENGIKITYTLDAATSFIMGSSKYKPDCIVIGCEGFTVDGSIYDRVGACNLAVVAYEFQIPFFVVTQFMKLEVKDEDSHNTEEDELFNKEDIWRDSSENITTIVNKLDHIPSKYITGGLVTEKGLISPIDIKKYITS